MSTTKSKELRLLHFMAGNKAKPCRVEEYNEAENQNLRLCRADGKVLVYPKHAFEEALNNDLINCLKGSHYQLNPTGRAKLIRLHYPDDGYREQHWLSQTKPANSDDDGKKIRISTSESPLQKLATRQNNNTGSSIGAHEVEAGERLRRDFEKSGLSPSISANWSLAGSGSKKGAASSSSGQINDMALDAKARLNKALDVLGPELSGVTLDICCFLKGLEQVERERQWPRRSARLMIKTALSILARHYGLAASASNKARPIASLETHDNRPHMFG